MNSMMLAPRTGTAHSMGQPPSKPIRSRGKHRPAGSAGRGGLAGKDVLIAVVGFHRRHARGLCEERVVQRRFRVAGWGLVAVGVAAIAIIVTAGAFGAHSDTAFNRWIGWATVAAVPLAALGVLLVVLDKLVKPDAVGEGRVRDIEDQLA